MDHHLWLWRSVHASTDLNAMPSGTLSPGSSKISGNGPDKARSDAQWLGRQGNVLCTGTSWQPDTNCHQDPACQTQVCNSRSCQLMCVYHGIVTPGPLQTSCSQEFCAQSIFFFSSLLPSS